MDDVVYVNDHDTLLFFTTEVRGAAVRLAAGRGVTWVGGGDAGKEETRCAFSPPRCTAGAAGGRQVGSGRHAGRSCTALARAPPPLPPSAPRPAALARSRPPLQGKAYSLRAYDVPEASRTAVGTAVTQVGGRREARLAACMGGRSRPGGRGRHAGGSREAGLWVGGWVGGWVSAWLGCSRVGGYRRDARAAPAPHRCPCCCSHAATHATHLPPPTCRSPPTRASIQWAGAEAGRAQPGRQPLPPQLPLKQVLKLDKGVRVAAMVPVSDFGVAPPGSATADAAAAERDVVMLTRQVGSAGRPAAACLCWARSLPCGCLPPCCRACHCG